MRRPRATGRRMVSFLAHPLLSPIVPILGSPLRWAAKTLRKLLSSRRAPAVQREVLARAEKLKAASPSIANALEGVQWQDIPRLRHSSSRQQLQFHRLKGARLPGWDRVHERWGCPHCPQLGAAEGNTIHIVWDCPAAQQLWHTLRSSWTESGLWYDQNRAAQHDYATAIFSLKPPARLRSDQVRRSLHPRPPPARDDGARPSLVLQAIWQQTVLETIIVITSWRNGLHDPERAWTGAQARAMQIGSIQRVLAALGHKLSLDPTQHPADIDFTYDVIGALGYNTPRRSSDEQPGYSRFGSPARRMP